MINAKNRNQFSYEKNIVNGHLAPLWAAAIAEASKKATRGMTVLSDSNDYVRGWINTHGGELITRLSDESRLAIMNVILRGQGLRMAPRDIAKEVRPLIGLNDRQAAANQKYKQEVFQRYLDHGLSESKVAERAEKAALKYAGKQHRYRAETIVLTENAFAYNRGAHMGVSQSIADGYMGRCAMIWTTAGTNRVCSRCLALKDTVVGYTDELGVTLPPLHPRCRCAIMYDEVGTPRATRPKPINPLLPVAVATEIISPATPEPQTDITGGGVKFKPLTPEREKEIKDAEDVAYNTETGTDFGFKKMKRTPHWANELRYANGDRKGFERIINCQRCVVAHEARMRGYDVIARPSWGTDDLLQKVENWLNVFNGEKETYNCVGSKPDEIKTFIDAKMNEWGAGSRAFVWFNWDNRKSAGHVIVSQLNENGFVQYGDPQVSKIGAVSYLGEVKIGSVVMMRVDNLSFTDIVKRCCMNKE